MDRPAERGAGVRRGDRAACVICNPKDRVPHWMVWAGIYELNEGVPV